MSATNEAETASGKQNGETFNDEMKDYAKSTMNELLGMFGYEEAITREAVEELQIRLLPEEDDANSDALVKPMETDKDAPVVVNLNAGEAPVVVEIAGGENGAGNPSVLPVPIVNNDTGSAAMPQAVSTAAQPLSEVPSIPSGSSDGVKPGTALLQAEFPRMTSSMATSVPLDLEMKNCVKCSSLTKYVCLKCAEPVCNKSKECSVPADEDSPGWKADVSVAHCISCSDVPTLNGTKQASIPADDSKPITKKSTAKKDDTGPRKCLTLKEKVEVIQKSNEGNSTRKLARMFGCGKTQIVNILKVKAKVLELWNSNEGTKSQKRLRVEKYSKINGLLWEWYTRARASNIPVSGPMLIEEAQIIAERIGDVTFKGTSGWLDKWKKRRNISQMNIAGEEGDVSLETLDSWNGRVKELTRGYSPRDIWNEDETGCFWKTMPEKSLSVGKNVKQRLVTAAFFVNAAGDKEALIVIGSCKLPRCFTHLADPSYPCGAQYFSNEKALMSKEIMVTLLTRLNNRLKTEERRIILFLDNAPCHPPSLTDLFSNIKVAFLPKNMSLRTQPLDAGIIKVWKIYYKRKLLRHIVGQVDGEHSANDVVKSVNLLMAVRWMVNSWDEIKGDVISKCFRRVGMYPSAMDLDEDDDDDLFAGEELLDLKALVEKMSERGIDIAPYAAIDYEAEANRSLDPANPNWRETLRDEILATHTNSYKTEMEIGVDDDSDDAPLPIPAVRTVKGALDLASQIAEFADYQGCEELSSAATKLTNILVDMKLKTQKQWKILDFMEKR